MWANHEYDVDDPHFLDPSTRKVDFSDDESLKTDTHWLRLAWQALPPTEDVDKQVLEDFMVSISNRSSQTLRDDETNPDRTSLNTPWRIEIKKGWNSIFARVMELLNGASGTVGTFTGDYDLVIPYPDNFEVAAIQQKVFENNVIILPVFLADGVTVRITKSRTPTDDDDSLEQEVESFDSDNATVIRYLRHDIEFNFYVDIDAEEYDNDEPAAVFAVGVLLVDDYVHSKIQDIHTMDEERAAAGQQPAIGPGAKSTNYLPPREEEKVEKVEDAETKSVKKKKKTGKKHTQEEYIEGTDEEEEEEEEEEESSEEEEEDESSEEEDDD